MIITSTRNPLIQRVRRLAARRREREATGTALLEGVRQLEAALAAGVAIAYCLATPAAAARPREAAALARLSVAGVPVWTVAERVAAAAADTETTQGLLAAFHLPPPRPWGDGPVLVADGLQDPGNLGTLIRAGAALGAGGCVCPAGCTDPWAPKVVRAAAGGLFRLPLRTGGDVAAALADLKAAGRAVYVAEAAAGEPPWALDWQRPLAVVVGSEAHGPSAAARRLADRRVRIPMPGGADSLNAGVAGALLLYESLRANWPRPAGTGGSP